MTRNTTSGLTNKILFPCCGIILIFTSFEILNLIYQEQKSAYMDEIFHVPQAQTYCRNQWTEWNPKITTPPGLYIVSYVLLKPFESLGYQNYCTLFALRLTNLVSTIWNFYLAFRIISSLEKTHVKAPSQDYLKLLSAFNIAIFPPLYFFTFLYYTDVWSTTFVLLMYHSYLSKNKFSRIMAAFASFMAVLMRQTNVVWVGFMILIESWNTLVKNVQTKTVPVQDYKYTTNVLSIAVTNYFSFNKKNSKSLFNLITKILFQTYHYIVICLLFIIFVFLNGSIVLGDKEAHPATFHPMQNLYFLNFATFFGLPFVAVQVLSLPKFSTTAIFFFLTLFTILSEVNKLEHPYLLADNRHLAFYLWKRVYGHSIVRRLIVPSYVFSGILLRAMLQKTCNFMFVVALSVCVFLNLTPQHLFELRYFIIPFIICRLHFKSNYVVILETIFFIFINAAVIYLFLSRPFVWQSEPTVTQRFIW